MDRLQSDKERISPPSLALHEPQLDGKMSLDTGQDHLPKEINDVEQDEIRPNDNISNVGSRKHGSRSGASRTSTSSVSSSRIKAEAEIAALLAQQKILIQSWTIKRME